MSSFVVQSYENYREEDRLTTNNARRIEFLTTVRAFDALLPAGASVLDCAAGTGVYAFHLAERGFRVTATDITPRHIAIMREHLAEGSYQIDTAVADATNLSRFPDGSFDVVLNMGPFYHLPDSVQRRRCFDESLRVLKPGGLLAIAYIPRFFVFQYVALSDDRYLTPELAHQLVETGALTHDDANCFWTDTYYATPEEMVSLLQGAGMTVCDHFAQDGIAPLMREKIDRWNDTQFRIWCDHHYSVCREPSVLGMSNHVVIIGRKKL